MSPIRSRPAPESVVTVPPSLFLIKFAERRRTWRREHPGSSGFAEFEIDLRSPGFDSDNESEPIARPM